MARALIIGCGAVATVAIKKCCTASEVFSEICIASRHRENCEKLAQELRYEEAALVRDELRTLRERLLMAPGLETGVMGTVPEESVPPETERP